MDDWFSCQENNFILTVSIDIFKSKSLIETSKARIEFIKDSSVDKFGNFIFEAYYSSVLELGHALLLLKGFSSKNHLCLGYYFRDILKDDSLFELFDFCRQKRNSLLYYGSMYSSDQAVILCDKAKLLFSKLDSLFQNL